MDKICGTCGVKKDLQEFYFNPITKKHVFNCKQCFKDKRKVKSDNKKEHLIKSRVFLADEIYTTTDICQLYEVSNMGNVFSLKTLKQLKPGTTKDGYLSVVLYMDDGSTNSIAVHRIVAKAFIPNPLNLPQVNHIDGDKKNNKASNLEWVTIKENINHAIETGLRVATINLKVNNMFTPSDIRNIRDMFRRGVGNQEIAKKYNCNHSTISKIRTGSHYSNIN